MSLKTFHLVFIATAATLAFGFGAWCIRFQQTHGEAGYTAIGVASLAVGAALVGYGLWAYAKLRGWNDDDSKKTSLWVIPGGSRGPRTPGGPGV